MNNNRLKQYSTIIFLVLLLASCKESGNVNISGNYPDGKGDYLILEQLNNPGMQLVDSARVSRKGNFSFSLALESPELLILKNQRGEVINLLPFPEDNISVNISGERFSTGYAITGSKTSENIRGLVEKLEITRRKLDSISDVLNTMEDKESHMAQVLVSTYLQLFQNQKRENIRFIVENINSPASIYALYQRISPDVYLFDEVGDIQYMKIVADSAKVKYPGSTLTSSLLNDLEKRMSDYNNMVLMNQLSKSGAVEAGIINLEIEDPSGKAVSLKSLQGKVVLLNFWASWDAASREATRLLKPVYNQYHSRGFEIYAVALDNDKNTWETAINFEEYPWINVSELTYPYSYAANAYNISSLPANYLIDREGNILARNIYGKTLSTWLDNLL